MKSRPFAKSISLFQCKNYHDRIRSTSLTQTKWRLFLSCPKVVSHHFSLAATPAGGGIFPCVENQCSEWSGGDRSLKAGGSAWPYTYVYLQTPTGQPAPVHILYVYLPLPLSHSPHFKNLRLCLGKITGVNFGHLYCIFFLPRDDNQGWKCVWRGGELVYFLF